VAVSDSQVVLELFSESPPAAVYASIERTRGLGQTAAGAGICHSLPVRQAQHAVAGVKSQNSLLPGEVVS